MKTASFIAVLVAAAIVFAVFVFAPGRKVHTATDTLPSANFSVGNRTVTYVVPY